MADMFTRLKVLEMVGDFEVEEQQAIKDNFPGKCCLHLVVLFL